jgi:hypothetical protein
MFIMHRATAPIFAGVRASTSTMLTFLRKAGSFILRHYKPSGTLAQEEFRLLKTWIKAQPVLAQRRKGKDIKKFFVQLRVDPKHRL